MKNTQLLFRLLCTSGGLVGFLALATNGQATPLPLGGGGVLQISNLTGDLLGLSNTCINWNSVAPCTNPPGSVQDSVSGQDPALFTVGSNALDTIKDLPAGVVTPLIDFNTVQSPLPGGVVHFDLTSIVIPAIPAGNNCVTFALSAICNPGGGSPFTLFQQSANQVSISFSTTEEAYSGTSGVAYNAATPYDGIFTSQLSGLLPNGQTDTIPNILAFLAGGGTITSTWSGTESPMTSPVPEPASPSLLGAGLIGLGVFSRKLRRA